MIIKPRSRSGVDAGVWNIVDVQIRPVDIAILVRLWVTRVCGWDVDPLAPNNPHASELVLILVGLFQPAQV